MARVNHNFINRKIDTLMAPHIFVVDMINGFCKEGAMADRNIMDIVPDIQKILYIPNQVRKPIFFIDAHEENAIEFKSFPKHCVKDTEECKIVEELKDVCGYEIINKNSTNGFHELQEYLSNIKTINLREIIVTGCCTDICVMQFALTLKTWLNATNTDIEVIIPVNCVDTYDSGNEYHPAHKFNEMALTLMEQAGITIIGGFDYE